MMKIIINNCLLSDIYNIGVILHQYYDNLCHKFPTLCFKYVIN